MDRIIRAFPLLPGKRRAFEEFQQTMRRKAKEAAAFYARYNVVRESWYLQQTLHGDVIIACTELSEVHTVAPKYAAATEEFDVWFKQSVKDITGIDPNKQPLGPDCVCVFDWQKS